MSRGVSRIRMALVAAAALAGASALDMARAATIRTPRAVVEFGEGDRSLAEAAPHVLESIRSELENELGLVGPELVCVRVSREARAFSGTIGGLPVELYAGMAYPSSGRIEINAASMDRPARRTVFVRTLRHEYVHLAVGNTLRDKRLPKWFEEGLACAFGSPLPREDAALVAGGRGYKLSALVDRFPPSKDGLALAYAQSESVVRYLVSRSSNRGIREVLRRVAAGRPFDAALEEATGFTTETLEESWRLRSRPSRFERTMRVIFGPGRVLLWTALFVVAGFFIVRHRRRRAAERLDDFV